MTTAGTARIAIATTNGELGGGEVMLLHIAAALDELGIEVVVIGPAAPAALVQAAESRGFSTITLPATSRIQYMAALALWRLRHPRIPLWCNGLVPSLATAGIGPRLVHLHMLPVGNHRAAVRVARWRASRVLVPSRFVADHVPGATVLENWTELPSSAPFRAGIHGPAVVGFLGRLTRDKGVNVLARAMVKVASGRDVRLVLAGQTRFGRAGEDDALHAALVGIETNSSPPWTWPSFHRPPRRHSGWWWQRRWRQECHS